MLPALPFRYTVCGLKELHLHRAVGVTHVLSILNPDEPVPAVLEEYDQHLKLELRFRDHIHLATVRRFPAEREHIEALLGFARRMVSERRKDAHLLVHCHGGQSRSTASLALMMAMVQPRLPATWILGEIVRIRPKAWPSLLVTELGDEMLGRDGELIGALGCIYREQLRRMPEMEAKRRESGRERELELALAVTELGLRMRGIPGRAPVLAGG